MGSATTNRGELPPGSPFQATFSFPQGTFLQTVIPAQPQIDFNPTTCVSTFTGDATFVATGGTNQLAGASGGGTLTANTTTVARRSADGTCLGPDSPPPFQVSVIRYSGNISLGPQ